MADIVFEERVKQDVFFAAEAGDYIGVSRQQINNLIKNGGIKPVKSSASGSLFLRDELDRYLNRKGIANLYQPKEIIGNGSTRISLDYFFNTMKEHNRIVGVFAYFNSNDAINDGFYTTPTFPKRGELTKVIAPTMIIQYENTQEVWFDGFNAGYCGEGPHGTHKVVKTLGISEDEANLIFSSEWIKFFREDDEWRVMRQPRDSENANSISTWNCDIKTQVDMYTLDQKLVIIPRGLQKSYVEEDPIGFLKNYFYYLPSPVSVTLYTREMAGKTKHYMYSSAERIYYQIVIQDRTGRELWLNYFVNETLPVERQKDLVDILNALEITIPKDKMIGIPEFLKNLLGMKLTVHDYVTLYRK